jgi:peptidoglycan/LPS O-acetylase OafA/YrhL
VSRGAAHAGWLLGAAVAAGSAVLALAAPVSWWGATFALGVLGGMLAARPVVRASYRPAWTRSVVLVTLGATLAGSCFAFAVEPWGPRPAVAWPLGIALLVVVFGTVADAVPSGFSTSIIGKRRLPREWIPPEERYGRRR